MPRFVLQLAVLLLVVAFAPQSEARPPRCNSSSWCQGSSPTTTCTCPFPSLQVETCGTWLYECDDPLFRTDGAQAQELVSWLTDVQPDTGNLRAAEPTEALAEEDLEAEEPALD